MDKTKIDINREQISCCLDNQLEQEELEQLIDQLLQDSSEAQQLRNEWHNTHLLSSNMLEEQNDSNSIFELKDISAQVAKQIADEPAYTTNDPKDSSGDINIPSSLIKPKMTSNADFFAPFKILATASAFAASLALVIFNLINMQDDNYNNNKTIVAQKTQIQKTQMQRTIDSSLIKNTPVMVVSKGLSQNLPEYKKVLFLKNQTQFYNSTLNNYNHSVSGNRINTNLIHKVSLKQTSKP
ncbi:MAG: RseA family anti-sigma factor [Pseudomonadota bacterium]